MRFVLPFLLAFFAACTPQGGTLDAPQTGISGHYTQQMVISEHPHHVLMGHLVAATRDGTRTTALVIGHRRDGVHRLRILEAWSDGVELPFAPTTSRLDGCTHGHCRDNAVGFVFLSEAQLANARNQGLSARLVARSGMIDIQVPRSLFLALRE